MDVEIIIMLIQILLPVTLVIVTIRIAQTNHKLTSDNEKFNHGRLIIDFQDKLSDAILKEIKIKELHMHFENLHVRDAEFDERLTNYEKQIESFVVHYLNITNAISYLFVMEKSMLKNHKNYFGFYIAYANKLLTLIQNTMESDQPTYWEYIKKCVDQYDMKATKKIPEAIKTHYESKKIKTNVE